MTETLVVLAAVAVCAGVGVSPLASVSNSNPQGPRGRADRRAEQQFAAAVMLAATCGLLSLWLFGKSGEPWWPMVILLGGCVPIVHPWLLAQVFFIPMGMSRAAYLAGRLSGHPWYRDPNGGAVLAGVMASLRRRRANPERSRWLRTRLEQERLGGAGIVAVGLLAADAGDRDSARRILGNLDEIDPDICPPLARQIALDWLVADAAGRGAWHELVDRVADDPFPTATTRFVGLAARRLIGDAEATRRAVLWAWMVAPRRLRTIGLAWNAVVRARRSERAIEDRDLSRLAANGAPEPILEALALHAEMAATDRDRPMSPAIIERLAAAWNGAFADFGLRGDVRDRAEHFAVAANGELLVARLQRAVAHDLALLIARTGRDACQLTCDSGILRRARDVHFEEVLERIGKECAALGRLRHPELGPAAAWGAWVALRESYLLAVVPLDLAQRAMVYSEVELQVRSCAAWLWNDRKERGLAHAMCLFLLAEAERVRDVEAAKYYRHNVVVGL